MAKKKKKPVKYIQAIRDVPPPPPPENSVEAMRSKIGSAGSVTLGGSPAPVPTQAELPAQQAANTSPTPLDPLPAQVPAPEPAPTLPTAGSIYSSASPVSRMGGPAKIAKLKMPARQRLY